MSKTLVVLAALAVAGLASVAAHAQGQTSGQNYAQPGAMRPGSAPSTPAPPPGSGSGGADEDRALNAPVLSITSVEVIRSTHTPVMDIIRVRGLTSTAGWEEAELVPLTRGSPGDGILELVFVARAPAEAVEASGFETVEAIFPLEHEHPYRGVNVHSASDSVTVAALPGYAEGKGAGDDCSKCVDKTFVPKGAALPPGKAAAEVVREEQLPHAMRIIRPADGIASADSNPNRLTLILNKEGKI